jgi:Adenylate and Guanylate cyclase catalytic domain/3'5'-cyclic nucleotide phosphodiesterase
VVLINKTKKTFWFLVFGFFATPAVNTASRMESTGTPGKIQVSQSTAALLIAAGKGHWTTPRDDQVAAKGKGSMQTYWAEPHTGSKSVAPSATVTTTSESSDSNYRVSLDGRIKRLVQWKVDVLVRLVKQIVAQRESLKKTNRSSVKERAPVSFLSSQYSHAKSGIVLDEVKEIIELPDFDATSFRNISDISGIILDPVVIEQIHQFVTAIATMYPENPFHNFEHASHVTMSVSKLMARIVAPDQLSIEELEGDTMALKLHDHTYGITSDPLTHFACVFSALIHDVDHPGVPNAQLVKENTPMSHVNCVQG